MPTFQKIFIWLTLVISIQKVSNAARGHWSREILSAQLKYLRLVVRINELFSKKHLLSGTKLEVQFYYFYQLIGFSITWYQKFQIEKAYQFLSPTLSRYHFLFFVWINSVSISNLFLMDQRTKYRPTEFFIE